MERWGGGVMRGGVMRGGFWCARLGIDIGVPCQSSSVQECRSDGF